MRKYKVVILNRTDQDYLIVKTKSLDKNKSTINNPIKPKSPKKTLDERIIEAVSKAIQPLQMDINEIKTTLKTVVRLNNLKTK